MSSTTPSRRTQLQEDTYFRVLRMLQDNPDLTQREIAQQLGVRTSGLNDCLNALIDKGWVKVQNFSQSKNKFGYIYVLTPSGIAQSNTAPDFRFDREEANERAGLGRQIAEESAQASAEPRSGLALAQRIHQRFKGFGINKLPIPESQSARPLPDFGQDRPRGKDC